MMQNSWKHIINRKEIRMTNSIKQWIETKLISKDNQVYLKNLSMAIDALWITKWSLKFHALNAITTEFKSFDCIYFLAS